MVRVGADHLKMVVVEEEGVDLRSNGVTVAESDEVRGRRAGLEETGRSDNGDNLFFFLLPFSKNNLILILYKNNNLF